MTDTISQIVKLSEWFATNHPFIQHKVLPNGNRFVRMNFDEDNTGSRSNLEFPRVQMLTWNDEPISGNFSENQGDSLKETIIFGLRYLDNCPFTDYDKEHEIYDKAFQFCKDIYLWIYSRKKEDINSAGCFAPLVERIDISSIIHRRVGPRTQDHQAFGWEIYFFIENYIDEDSATPNFLNKIPTNPL